MAVGGFSKVLTSWIRDVEKCNYTHVTLEDLLSLKSIEVMMALRAAVQLPPRASPRAQTGPRARKKCGARCVPGDR